MGAGRRCRAGRPAAAGRHPAQAERPRLTRGTQRPWAWLAGEPVSGTPAAEPATVAAMTTGSRFAGAGPEETERRVEQWAAEFAAKADRYQQMQQQISQVSAAESSADGAVRVTVDS